jgi:hypothetical protein
MPSHPSHTRHGTRADLADVRRRRAVVRRRAWRHGATDRRRAGAQEVEVEGSRPCCSSGSGGVGVDLERGSRKRERRMDEARMLQDENPRGKCQKGPHEYRK